MEILNQLPALPAYRMVVVNVIFLIILCLGLFINRFIWPKKSISYLTLTFLFSIPPIISIFRNGTYESGDLSLHATRLMAFWQALTDGSIIPNWAGILNAGYGYPLFEFIYPLPYYLGSFFHLLGFSFINSIKILLILAYVGSGMFMFLWLKQEVPQRSAFIGAIFYLFAPYHLVDLHFRVAIGEILAFSLLPLTLYSIKKWSISFKDLWFIVAALCFGFLVLSHQAISLVSPIIIFPYGFHLWQKKRWWKHLSYTLLPIIVGLLFSAFYWLPVIIESKFTFGPLLNKNVFYPTFKEFIYSPWRLGLLFQGPNGELSFTVGYFHWLIILIAVLFLIRKKYIVKQKLLVIFVSLFFILFFLTQKESWFIWNQFSLLKKFQFTYRLLLPISLVSSTIAGLIINKTNSTKLICLLCLLVIGVTILNWGNRRVIPQIDDQYLTVDLPFSTFTGEGLHPAAPKWSLANLWYQVPAPTAVSTTNSKATIITLLHQNNLHQYQISTAVPVKVNENTAYFPGWTLIVDGRKKPILYETKDHYGLISFNLLPGSHNVILKYQDTLTRKLAKAISILSIAGLGTLIISRNFRAKLSRLDKRRPSGKKI